MLYIVATDTARNPVRSGIQTLVRSLLSAYARTRAPRTRAVRWDRKKRWLTLLPVEATQKLGAGELNDPRPLSLVERMQRPTTLIRADGRHLPLHRHPHHAGSLRGGWLLIPELIYGLGRAREVLRYARRQGLRVAVLVHDVIPIDHPECSAEGVPEMHRDFLLACAEADLVLATSQTVTSALTEFFARERLSPPPLTTVRLPAEFHGAPRCLIPPSPEQARRALCVSTLEPRKNHAGLLAALDLLASDGEPLPFELDLIGADHAHSAEVRDLVTAAVARHRGRVRWLGQVADEQLAELYRTAGFTIYPSVVEGFGIPVMESLWFSRPCICADFSVMAENAAGGGCLVTDVRQPAALAGAIRTMLSDAALRDRLAREAMTRPLTSWTDYAAGVVAALEAAQK